ncbi:MAG: hypothetical protein LRY50_01760 [Geovibrio sp.]|nr:hypothetical protein [Geovibrio sp.]
MALERGTTTEPPLTPASLTALLKSSAGLLPGMPVKQLSKNCPTPKRTSWSGAEPFMFS